MAFVSFGMAAGDGAMAPRAGGRAGNSDRS